MGNFSFSQFMSGSSSINNSSQIAQVLRFGPSPTENTAILIQRVGPQGDTFPLFTFTTSKSSKPHVQLRRVGAGITILQPTLIGDATFHTFSSKIDLNWNGQALPMKARDIGDGYKLECVPFGKLKWESGKATGHKLTDGDGNQLARYRSSWSGINGSTLEISQPVDDLLLDLIVLSLIAVVETANGSAEGAAEFVSAVAGA